MSTIEGRFKDGGYRRIPRLPRLQYIRQLMDGIKRGTLKMNNRKAHVHIKMEGCCKAISGLLTEEE